jgi:mRNA interferase MazF
MAAPLRRGSVATAASPVVNSGNPRPTEVVQADRWLQAHPSVTL